MVKRSWEGTWKLSTCQPRSQCFSLLFYLLFFRDWNAVVQYHTIQCLLIFCNTYHRQPSVCFTETSRSVWSGKHHLLRPYNYFGQLALPICGGNPKKKKKTGWKLTLAAVPSARVTIDREICTQQCHSSQAYPCVQSKLLHGSYRRTWVQPKEIVWYPRNLA